MADDSSQVPDVYSDIFNILENPLGVMVLLHRSEPPERGTPTAQKTKPVAILRFSPENWKVILMTGRNQLKKRELTNGVPYKVPAEILTPLGLTEADW